MCHVRELCAKYVPKECEIFYRSSLRAAMRTDSDRAASSLLSKLDQKKQEQWKEGVNSINLSHSSRKVWITINKLTGRSGLSSCLCSISTNSIASKLMKSEAHKTRAVSPPGSSTRTCPSYGRSQHLREIVSLAPSRLPAPSTTRSLPAPSTTRKILRV